MALHLVKLCVGIETPDQLRASQNDRRQQVGAALVHTTRMMPRRRDEVLAGGSLYWVMKGAIRCRQPILDLEAVTDPESGRSACRIHFDPAIIDTEQWPWRPFQGWRYLVAEKAPPDRPASTTGVGDETTAMPEALRRDLRDLGLI